MTVQWIRNLQWIHKDATDNSISFRHISHQWQDGVNDGFFKIKPSRWSWVTRRMCQSIFCFGWCVTHTITSSFGTVIRLSESINGSAIAAAVEAPNGKNKEREINDLSYQYFPNCMDVDFGDCWRVDSNCYYFDGWSQD